MREFGKFRLVELLASGGMAEVWRAELPGAAGFVKELALKLVRGEHREDDAFTRMFIQEARLASRLDHANVVHVFELGQVDGQYYIAMELVRGRSLREVVDRCRAQGLRFGVPRAVHVGAEVARGLAYAHRLEVDGRPAGLVHRDVSPQNVLISYEGEVKLADFGIARASDADEKTRAGTIKGKLAYMAPEQARGERVDGRADVFALGIVLWELCAGRRLFARDGDAATLAAVLDAAPVSRPSEWNEAVPPELDVVIMGALERDRERRIRSAEELERALAGLRLKLAAEKPDEIDLRALLRRLWPDGAASSRRPRERTAVMAVPPCVPVAAEHPARDDARAAPMPAVAPDGASDGAPTAAQLPDARSGSGGPDTQRLAGGGGERGGGGAGGANGEGEGGSVDPRDAPTRTMVKPRPFSGAGMDQGRRTLLLLLVLASALVLGVGLKRWTEREGGDRPRVPVGDPAAPADIDRAAVERDGLDEPRAAPDSPAASARGAREPERKPPAPRTEPPADAAPPGAPGAARQRSATTPPPGGNPASPPRERGATPPEEGASAPAPAQRGHGSAQRAHATLVVDVLPWATVYVDGRRVGDTPLTVRVPPGAHRVRAVHPKLGSATERIDVGPGERLRWSPRLSR